MERLVEPLVNNDSDELKSRLAKMISKAGWEKTLRSLSQALRHVYGSRWLGLNRAILQLFGMEELVGFDGDVHQELQQVSEGEDFGAIEKNFRNLMLRRAGELVQMGTPTVLYDLSELETTSSVTIVEDIVASRKREIKALVDRWWDSEDEVFVKELRRTAYGYQILKDIPESTEVGEVREAVQRILDEDTQGTEEPTDYSQYRTPDVAEALLGLRQTESFEDSLTKLFAAGYYDVYEFMKNVPDSAVPSWCPREETHLYKDWSELDSDYGHRNWYQYELFQRYDAEAKHISAAVAALGEEPSERSEQALRELLLGDTLKGLRTALDMMKMWDVDYPDYDREEEKLHRIHGLTFSAFGSFTEPGHLDAVVQFVEEITTRVEYGERGWEIYVLPNETSIDSLKTALELLASAGRNDVGKRLRELLEECVKKQSYYDMFTVTVRGLGAVEGVEAVDTLMRNVVLWSQFSDERWCSKDIMWTITDLGEDAIPYVVPYAVGTGGAGWQSDSITRCVIEILDQIGGREALYTYFMDHTDKFNQVAAAHVASIFAGRGHEEVLNPLSDHHLRGLARDIVDFESSESVLKTLFRLDFERAYRNLLAHIGRFSDMYWEEPEEFWFNKGANMVTKEILHEGLMSEVYSECAGAYMFLYLRPSLDWIEPMLEGLVKLEEGGPILEVWEGGQAAEMVKRLGEEAEHMISRLADEDPRYSGVAQELLEYVKSEKRSGTQHD